MSQVPNSPNIDDHLPQPTDSLKQQDSPCDEGECLEVKGYLSLLVGPLSLIGIKVKRAEYEGVDDYVLYLLIYGVDLA